MTCRLLYPSLIALAVGTTIASQLIAATFDDAAQAYQSGQWLQAINTLETLIEAKDSQAGPSAAATTAENDWQAYFYLAEALTELGRYEEAATRYAESLQLMPDEAIHQRRARFRLAESRYLSGQHRKALEALRLFVEVYPNDELNDYALPYLADTYLIEKQFQQSADTFAKHLALYPLSKNRVASQYGLAQASERAGQWQAATEAYMAAESIASPFQSRATFRLALISYRQQDYSAAIERFSKTIATAQQQTQQSEARYWRAMSQFALGRFALAIEDYDVLLQSESDDHQRSTTLQQYRQQAQRAIDAARRELATDRTDRNDTTVSSTTESNPTTAEPASRINESPTEWTSQLQQVCGHVQRAEYDVAAEQLVKLEGSAAHEQLESLDELWFSLAQQSRSEARHVSIEACERLISRVPRSAHHFDATIQLAELFAENAATADDSEALLVKFLQSEHTHDQAAAAWLLRSQLAASQSRWSDVVAALQNFRRQTTNPTELRQATFEMAEASMHQGQYHHARELCRNVVNSARFFGDEVGAQAQQMIGDTYFRQDDFEQAIQEYLRVEALYDCSPLQATALMQVANCYDRLERPTAAKRILRRLQSRFPDSTAAIQSMQRVGSVRDHATGLNSRGAILGALPTGLPQP